MSFLSRFWPSSQRAPAVKEEAPSNKIEQQDEDDTGSVQKFEQNVEGEADAETQYHDVWDGIEGSKEDGAEMIISTPSTSKKKKRKKKKKKKKKKGAAAEAEFRPQLEEDHSMEDEQLPDAGGYAADGGQTGNPAAGDIVADESMEEGTSAGLPVAEGSIAVENQHKPKRTRKSNGTTPKKKRAPKSKATLSSEDGLDRDEEVGNGSTLQVVIHQSREASEHVQAFKPSDADMVREAFDGEGPEPSTRDLLQEELSEFPRRIEKARKSKGRRVSAESRSQEEDADAAAVLHQSLSSSQIRDSQREVDNQDDSDDASSQLRRDAMAVSSPEAANNEDTEDEEPRRPSKKALGKRKAVDEPVSRGSNKKMKRGKDNEPAGQDIRTFGFMPRPRSSAASSQTSSLRGRISEITAKLYEETHGRSIEPEVTFKPQVSRSTWNAVNNSVEPNEEFKPRGANKPDEGEESVEDLSIQEERELENPRPSKAPPKSSARKRRLPVEGFGASASTPTTKLRPTPAKAKPKTPRTSKVKKESTKLPRATSTKGKLSTQEVDAITSAVNSYRELQNWTEHQMNGMIQSDAQKLVAQEMWKAICEEVPDIPRRSVQNTCRRKFHNFAARGVWTEDEDEELRLAYEEHPKKWKIIGDTLHRFPEDVRDRWRNYLVCGDTLKKDAWVIEEEERLRAAVKECIREAQKARSLSGGKSLFGPESLIDWQNVSERMGRTRSRLQCRNKWQKLRDREETHVDDPASRMPIGSSWRLEKAAYDARLFSAEEKLNLLHAIQDSGAAREGKIPWQTIKKDLDGKGKRMAWKYCFRTLKDRVLYHSDMEFKDIVTYLVEIFETAAPDEPEGYDLPILVDKPKRKKRTQNDNEDGPSTPRMRAGRKHKHGQPQDSDDGAQEASTLKRRRVRDRMLKEGESQEIVNSRENASADIGEDVVQSFQALKRAPSKKYKLVIRKSKRKQALSEEKIVESSSDDDEALANGHTLETHNEEAAFGSGLASENDDDSEVLSTGHTSEANGKEEAEINGHASETDEDEMEVDEETTQNTTSRPGLEDFSDTDTSQDQDEASEDEIGVHHRAAYTTIGGPIASDDSEDEAAQKQEEESEEDVGISSRINSYHPEGSPDLDTPVHGKTFKKLGSPFHTNGYHGSENSR